MSRSAERFIEDFSVFFKKEGKQQKEERKEKWERGGKERERGRALKKGEQQW
jgi:hypothetical protein